MPWGRLWFHRLRYMYLWFCLVNQMLFLAALYFPACRPLPHLPPLWGAPVIICIRSPGTPQCAHWIDGVDVDSTSQQRRVSSGWPLCECCYFCWVVFASPVFLFLACVGFFQAETAVDHTNQWEKYVNEINNMERNKITSESISR